MAQEQKSGNLFILSLSADDTTYMTMGCTTSNDFSVTFETSDASCKEDGAAPKNVFTKFTGEISFEGLVLVDDTTQEWNLEQLHTWAKAGTDLFFKYGLQNTTEKQITGQCLISNIVGPTAPKDGPATASLTAVLNSDYAFTANA